MQNTLAPHLWTTLPLQRHNSQQVKIGLASSCLLVVFATQLVFNFDPFHHDFGERTVRGSVPVRESGHPKCRWPTRHHCIPISEARLGRTRGKLPALVPAFASNIQLHKITLGQNKKVFNLNAHLFNNKSQSITGIGGTVFSAESIPSIVLIC